jgi:prolyl oligopeptidase
VAQRSSLSYPSARRADVIDDYFGTRVADPYRWMEDLASPELKEWIDAQNVTPVALQIIKSAATLYLQRRGPGSHQSNCSPTREESRRAVLGTVNGAEKHGGKQVRRDNPQP